MYPTPKRNVFRHTTPVSCNKVTAQDFADGCAAEQRKHYGCAPDADRVERLRKVIQHVAQQLSCVASPIAAEVQARLEHVLEGTK